LKAVPLQGGLARRIREEKTMGMKVLKTVLLSLTFSAFPLMKIKSSN